MLISKKYQIKHKEHEMVVKLNELKRRAKSHIEDLVQEEMKIAEEYIDDVLLDEDTLETLHNNNGKTNIGLLVDREEYLVKDKRRLRDAYERVIAKYNDAGYNMRLQRIVWKGFPNNNYKIDIDVNINKKEIK